MSAAPVNDVRLKYEVAWSVGLLKDRALTERGRIYFDSIWLRDDEWSAHLIRPAQKDFVELVGISTAEVDPGAQLEWGLPRGTTISYHGRLAVVEPRTAVYVTYKYKVRYPSLEALSQIQGLFEQPITGDQIEIGRVEVIKRDNGWELYR